MQHTEALKSNISPEPKTSCDRNHQWFNQWWLELKFLRNWSRFWVLGAASGNFWGFVVNLEFKRLEEPEATIR